MERSGMEVTPLAPILTILAAPDFLINSYPNTFDPFAIVRIVPNTYFQIDVSRKTHSGISGSPGFFAKVPD